MRALSQKPEPDTAAESLTALAARKNEINIVFEREENIPAVGEKRTAGTKNVEVSATKESAFSTMEINSNPRGVVVSNSKEQDTTGIKKPGRSPIVKKDTLRKKSGGPSGKKDVKSSGPK